MTRKNEALVFPGRFAPIVDRLFVKIFLSTTLKLVQHLLLAQKMRPSLGMHFHDRLHDARPLLWPAMKTLY